MVIDDSGELDICCAWEQQLQNSRALGAGRWASGASNKTEPPRPQLIRSAHPATFALFVLFAGA